MEKIVNTPGLQHLAEKVFWDMDVEDLKICAQINQSCKLILQYPIFCLRKFKGFSNENHKEWIKVIQSVKNFDKGIAIISYLQWNFKKQALMDLPCYSSPVIQYDFRKKIRRSTCHKIIQILAPLTDKPNAPDENGFTPIHEAARNGHVEIVKILASLTDNPNAPDENGVTPIHEAALEGHTEIVKILVPMTDNPNVPDKFGRTPIYWAADMGHAEIVKILAPLRDNPNAPEKDGKTPIYWAARNGHTDIVKIFETEILNTS